MNAYATGRIAGIRFAREWRDTLHLWADAKLADLALTKAQSLYTHVPAQQRYRQGFVEAVQQCQQGLSGAEPGTSIYHACTIVHIRDAVWGGEINQITTRQVSERFACPLPIARKALLDIVRGVSGDARFVLDTARGEGVIVSHSRNFNYSPMGIDGEGAAKNVPEHYVWFLS
jgi:hypothetical protein